MSHKPFSGCSGTFQGNGNPLQYSCLENPMDGGAWWAAVYGVAQSRTRLKRLSCSSRHIPLFHHRLSWIFSLPQEPEVGIKKKCCHLVDISCSYNWPPMLTGTSNLQGLGDCSWQLPSGILSCGGYCMINFKHKQLSGSQLSQVYLPHTLKG